MPKEGILNLQPSGRWAICLTGHPPIEITSERRSGLRSTASPS